MLEANGNSERLARSYNELMELQLVLEKAGSFFDSARAEAAAESFGERAYSVPEAMDAPLLESALPVRGGRGRAVVLLMCCSSSTTAVAAIVVAAAMTASAMAATAASA